MRLRSKTVVFVVFAAVASVTLPTTAPAQVDGADLAAQEQAAEEVIAQIERDGGGLSLSEIDKLDELGPKPWLSLPASQSPRAVEAWRRVASQLPASELVGDHRSALDDSTFTFVESEGPEETGGNDTPATGDPIAGFGTGEGDEQMVTITGHLSGAEVRPPVESDCESVEDDGAIPLANPTPASEIEVALCIGEIGDGPFGETSGDIDFFSYGVVEEGSVLILDTWHISGSLDPVSSVIGIYTESGELLGSLEDPGGIDGEDPFLQVIAPATGVYYGGIAGCCELSSDPGDSSSGPGVGDVGTYELFVVTFPPPCGSVEDDGAIPLANPTGLVSGAAVRVSGIVGDGPHGSSGGNTGDFDFFAVTGLVPGQTLVVDVDTPVPFGDLDPFVALWHQAGFLIAFNDDDGQTFDSRLIVQVPIPGDYFVSIGGFGSFITADPFDPSSGFGPGSEGDYDATISLDVGGVDVYTLDLEAGDSVGATVDGAATRVTLLDPAGGELVGAGGDLSFIYPPGSLLPGGGNASVAQVVNFDGRYGIEVTSAGAYAADIRVFRPGLSEVPSRQQQTLFIDFDGAVVDTSIYGLPPFIPQPRTLSPLSAFLTNWGLTAADENAVIDAILAAVEESLASDMRVLGLNGDRDASGNPTELDIAILNSRDHPDPFGQPNVSRVVVGGTIAEAAISTIGIAQSIDIGNFERSETALVLLDILSEPAPPNPSLFFLNNIALDPSASIVDLIGIAVGNIVAHEAGHFLSSFHTDQFNPFANIMDQGGNAAGTFGLGPDLVFGSADDEDVDFGPDAYVPNEGFTGTEDTLNATAFGLSTGRRRGGQ